MTLVDRCPPTLRCAGSELDSNQGVHFFWGLK